MALLKSGRRLGFLVSLTCQLSLCTETRSEIDFAEPVTAVFEGATLKVRVRRTGDTSQSATVTVQITSGEALPNLPTTLQFEPLQAEIALDLPTVDNPIPELDRPVELGLTNVSGATLGQNPTMRIRIVDNDRRPGSLCDVQGAQWQIDQSLVPLWTNNYDQMQIRSMAVGPAGRTYVVARKVGWSQILVFNADGLLERDFGPINVYASATQSDGKLLVTGELRNIYGQPVNSIARFTPAGDFDPTFAWGSYSAHGIYALAVQPDDKVVVGGLLRDAKGYALVRLLKDGQTDPSFSLGSDQFYYITRITLQPDGKILFAYAGYTMNPEFVVARANANGGIDPTFALQRGQRPNERMAHALGVQANGRILMSIGPELRGLTQTGVPDPEFKLGEQPDGLISEILNLPGDKILVAGTFKHIGGFERNGLARLNADGSVDTTFDPGVGAEVLHAVVLPGGDFLVGGEFQSYNLLPVKNLARISASVTPRFVLSKTPNDVQIWFTANPGQRVTIDQSADLKSWELLDSQIVGGFSTAISSNNSKPSNFLRARVE